jgi:formylmethanofuran dehydrogenase subunit A
VHGLHHYNESFYAASWTAKHTHEELNDTPMLDKATYPLLGDWWFVLEYLQKGDLEGCARHVAWMMGTSLKGTP